MKCYHCGNNVIWDIDHTFEDYGLDGDGIITALHCSVCNASYLVYLGEEDDTPK